MDNIFIAAASQVTGADVSNARLGMRFGRLDLSSQLALLAVESLGIDFSNERRESMGIFLASKAGSLSADEAFWQGRNAVGGPSPSLFTYTLASAAIGEIAIRHLITGPNFCLVGNDSVLVEAADGLRRGEMESCLCVCCDVVTPALAKLIQSPATAKACALLLKRDSGLSALGEKDIDIEALCAAICKKTSSI